MKTESEIKVAKWSEAEGSSRHRIGTDAEGKKCAEEFYESDGSRIFTSYQENTKLKRTEKFAPDGLLIYVREYDLNGTEAFYFEYNISGVLIHKAEYDNRGIALKRWQWSDSGLLLDSCEYLNNYRHGLHLKFSPTTGALISRIEYLNDYRDGKSEVFYEDPGCEGIKAIEFYSGGQLQGDFKYYFKNGNLSEQGRVEHGKFDGPRIFYFENAKVSKIQRFQNGNLQGLWEEFFENGQIQNRRSFDKGKLHGTEESFNDQGKLTRRACYIEGSSTEDFSLFEKEPKKEEVIETFFDSGQLAQRISYQLGRRNGAYELFYSNGKLRESGYYKNELSTGIRSYFNVEGMLLETISYLDGVKDGPEKSYFKSGQIKIESEYKLNKLISRKLYFENAQLSEVSEWTSDGTGFGRSYSDRGKLLQEWEFSSSLWHNFQTLHGSHKAYSENGDLIEENHYEKGFRQGVCRFYHSDGKLYSVGEYEKGVVKRATFYNQFEQAFRIISYCEDGSVASDEKLAIENNLRNLEKGALIDSYELIRALGRGGMGEVYLAYDRILDRKIALKFISGDIDKKTLERFISEAKALAKLNHKNIVSIYAIGSFEEKPYFAMEFVSGWTLASVIARGIFGIFEHIKFFQQLVDGMSQAHKVGIIHRDLKPANILIAKDMQVKIIDFGISKIYSSTEQDRTSPGAMIGTISYMSPEVVLGQPATPQSDIYGLGVILFEMLTGTRPFQGKNAAETLELTVGATLEFPQGISDVLPEKLKKLIAKMTAKNPIERYETLFQVSEDLAKISFEYLPIELKQAFRPELNIANADEIRKKLLEEFYSPSEILLILNLASRIQQKIISEFDKTQLLGSSEELVISFEVLNQAIERYETAILEVHSEDSSG